MKDLHSLHEELFEGSLVPLLACRDGEIILCNRAATSLLGTTDGPQLVGTALLDHVSPVSRAKVADLVARAATDDGDGTETVATFTRHNGSSLRVELTVARLRHPGANAVQIALRPISDQSAMAETELENVAERLSVLLEALPDPVFFKDGEGRWLFVSGPAHALFQLDGIDWQGKTEDELGEMQPQLAEAHAVCKTSDEAAWAARGMSTAEEAIPDPTGAVQIFETIKVPLFNRDGSRKGLVIVGRDVTARKEAEARLRESEARLHTANRALRAILGVNGLMVHATAIEPLLQGACEILVSELGLLSAWVAVADDGETYHVAACAGDDRISPGKLQTGLTDCARVAIAENRPWFRQAGDSTGCDECPLRAATNDVWALAMPILRSDRSADVLIVHGDSSAELDDATRTLLAELGADLAFALDSLDRARALRLRGDMLAAIQDTGIELTSHIDLPSLLRATVTRAERLVGATFAGIFLTTRDGKGLELALADGPLAARVGERLENHHGLIGLVAAQRAPLIIDHYQLWEGSTEAFRNAAVQAAVAVPLQWEGEVLGVLFAARDTERKFLPADGTTLSLFANQAAAALANASLLAAAQQAAAELEDTYDRTLEGWTRALDLRDRETEGHTQRVTSMTVRLARRMEVPAHDLVHIQRGALLHDIGKVGVPDSILNKPGPLEPDELAVMQNHPVYAERMLDSISFLQPALAIPAYHHERWDGSGYPAGLAGESIPIAARIFAVVDVFDAMTSDRPYRTAIPVQEVRRYLRQQAGNHFDPAVVREFDKMLDEEAGMESAATAVPRQETSVATLSGLVARDIATVEKFRNERDAQLKLAAVGAALPGIQRALQGPLSTATSTADRLLNEISLDSSRQHIQELTAALQHLALTVNGLGLVDRPLRTNSVEAVDSALVEAFHSLEHRFESRTIHGRCDVPPLPPMGFDARLLRAIAYNLLSNAIDACESGDVVTLRARALDQREGLELCVTDTGCGMNHAVLGRCRELLYSTKPRGGGMGLTLCDTAISRAGGEMQLASEEGRGTSVTVRLPLLAGS